MVLTMSNTFENLEIDPSPLFGMGNATSLRLGTLVDTNPHGDGTSYNTPLQLSYFVASYKSSSTGTSSTETHHIPSSIGTFIFGMPYLTIMSYTFCPSIYPSVMPRVTIDAFLDGRFGSGRITLFSPFVGIFFPRFKSGVHSYGSDPRHVNIGGTD